MIVCTRRIFVIFCIYQYHNVFGKEATFPKGLANDDVIEWQGHLPTSRGPSRLTIRFRRRNIRMEIQPARRKLVIHRRSCVLDEDSIASGKDFSMQIRVADQNYKIYINNVLKYTFRVISIFRPSRIRSVASGGKVQTTLLKKLTLDDYGSRLNHQLCGQIGRNRNVGRIIDKICKLHEYHRIIGGHPASPTTLPWQAAIRKKPAYTNNNLPHLCGASLIGECWVVSAAHCFPVTHPSSLRKFVVRVGDYFNDDSDVDNNQHFSPYENVQDLPIEKVYKHENYLPRSSTNPNSVNDIALIKLRKCARLGRLIRPVCLPTSDDHGDLCSISGWGATQWSQDKIHHPKCLLQGPVIIHQSSACERSYSDMNYINDVMFCAAGINGVDSCQGDSGGPLVCIGQQGEHTLVGLTSWGVECGNPNRPGVYTRISTFIKWIYMKIYFYPNDSQLEDMIEKGDVSSVSCQNVHRPLD